MRVNFVFPDELVKQIDILANELYMSRTAWVINAISDKLEKVQTTKSLPEITKMMNEIYQNLPDLMQVKSIEDLDKLQAKFDKATKINPDK